MDLNAPVELAALGRRVARDGTRLPEGKHDQPRAGNPLALGQVPDGRFRASPRKSYIPGRGAYRVGMPLHDDPFRWRTPERLRQLRQGPQRRRGEHGAAGLEGVPGHGHGDRGAAIDTEGAAGASDFQAVLVGDPQLILVDVAPLEPRRPRPGPVPRARLRRRSLSLRRPEHLSPGIADVESPVAKGGRVARLEREDGGLPEAVPVETQHLVQAASGETRVDGAEAHGHSVHDQGGAERISGDARASIDFIGHDRQAAHGRTADLDGVPLEGDAESERREQPRRDVGDGRDLGRGDGG